MEPGGGGALALRDPSEAWSAEPATGTRPWIMLEALLAKFDAEPFFSTPFAELF